MKPKDKVEVNLHHYIRLMQSKPYLHQTMYAIMQHGPAEAAKKLKPCAPCECTPAELA